VCCKPLINRTRAADSCTAYAHIRCFYYRCAPDSHKVWITSILLLSCRPYASGEVTVQPYNSLLSMTALAEISSGMLLLQNEALHATCTRLLGIKNPGFKVCTFRVDGIYLCVVHNVCLGWPTIASAGYGMCSQLHAGLFCRFAQNTRWFYNSSAAIKNKGQHLLSLALLSLVAPTKSCFVIHPQGCVLAVVLRTSAGPECSCCESLG
jgi:hypothetical protein